MLPPLKPIAMKERVSMVFIQKGQIDVKDGAFVVIDETGIRTHIPVGSIACIMLEPGTRVSHYAAALAARAGTLLVWVGTPVSDCMLQDNRAGHVRTACFTRPNWRWTIVRV